MTRASARRTQRVLGATNGLLPETKRIIWCFEREKTPR